jgi:uncharacterized sulfatase
MIRTTSTCAILCGCAVVLAAGLANGETQVEPETALKMLRSQDRQMERKVIKITDNVYTAVGFYGANTSMIVGDDDGVIIIVDTLKGPGSAA